ncbi:efflux transporter outer membrane subunit [Altererythrobacter xixiisoli]|uniref:Efflux transporter outer membrane subunit n=1 Tax=Croceibacterium xixiisoli TaxID=1476466 RepID=A0A6I4TTM1_9SPHN|nr:efflux transporter outer membrane subunit [Croceibacterium xixiisoli]
MPQLDPAQRVIEPQQFDADQALAAPLAEWPTDEWWHRYGDSQLDALIAQGIAHAPTLAVAEARIRRAEARISNARSANAPQIDAGASFAQAKASYWNGVPYSGVPKGVNDAAAVRLSLDWTLDFFGRNRAAIAAASSAAEAARAEGAQARLLLTTAIAGSYAGLLGEMREEALARATLDARDRTAQLVTQRREQGLETLASEAQARSAAETARLELVQATEAIALTRLEIAELTGQGPDQGLRIGRPAEPELPGFGLPSQIPADLIGRRPDLRAARLRVEAQAAAIDQARAGFYPSINLSAFIGPQILGLDHIFDAGSIAGSAGPAIHLPIFHGGALQAEYRGARADYDEAVVVYNQTLLHALGETARIVASLRSLEDQLAHALAAQEAAETAYTAASARYRGGLLNYINVLSAENMVIATRSTVNRLQTRRFELDVALVRALGGGV